MNDQTFEIFRSFLKDKSGLIVTPDKTYLLESRLLPIAKKHELADLDALATALKSNLASLMANEIIEAMTTNETSFFRDKTPFDNFTQNSLPYFLTARATHKKLNIWCAAASSGQEPYSLSMVLKEEAPKMPGWTTDIIATDISHDILAQAREGIYTQFEVQRGLPIQLLMKYFTQVNEKWQLNEDIRNSIKYEYFNLLDSMDKFGTYDCIFCRNVLIYFDEQTKGDILNRMVKHITPDGFLFLGGAETVIGITDAFVPMPGTRGLYVTKNSPHIETAKSAAAS